VDLPLWAWVVILGVLPVLYAVDLFVVPRAGYDATLRASVFWAVFWLAVGLAGAAVVALTAPAGYSAKYATGFLIEKGLTVELTIVVAGIMLAFDPPPAVARRALLFTLIVGVVLRIPFIALGAVLADSDRPLVHVLVAGCFFAGAVVLARPHRHHDPFDRPVLRLAERVHPFSRGYEDGALVVTHDGRRLFTKTAALFFVLATADLFFDATLPVAFAFQKPAGIVLLSSGFAMLGFRSVYLLVDRLPLDLERLRGGLAAVLALLGLDLLVHAGSDPPGWSENLVVLAVIVVPFALAIVRRPRASRLP
jgi:tellurite resistance protein TerC